MKAKTVNRWKKVTPKAEKINKKNVHTKPNGSQSIRDILFRNTSGMAYDNYKTPYYEEQATFSSRALNEIQEMEPAEKMQFLSKISKQAQELKQKIQSHEDEKKKAEIEQQAEIRAQQLLKEKQEQQKQ